MGLLTEDLSTIEAKIAKNKKDMDDELKRGFKLLVRSYEGPKAAVWDNPYGLTPQQVLDSFGTGAAELLRVAYITGTMINQLVPGSVIIGAPAGWTLTVNPDGTATATQVP